MSASVVLNGGGLEQLGTITRELNRAIGGENLAVKDLIPQLNSFVGALDEQKADIVATIKNLDRMSGEFAWNDKVIRLALDDLSQVATPRVEGSRADLIANLRSLAPTCAL